MATDIELGNVLGQLLAEELAEAVTAATARVDVEKHPAHIGRIRALRRAEELLNHAFEVANGRAPLHPPEQKRKEGVV